jgi:hypothetical protein
VSSSTIEQFLQNARSSEEVRLVFVLLREMRSVRQASGSLADKRQRVDATV